MKSIFTTNQSDREEGQALVEFALSLPILLLFIMGLIDFSVILFSYSQAQNSLRSALRYAQLIGYSEDRFPYLNCDALRDRATDSFFASAHQSTIEYVKASDPTIKYDCNTVSLDKLDNGDMLRMTLVADVDLFFLPYDDLQLNFSGQRSIVKMINIPYDEEAPPQDGIAVPANFVASPVTDATGKCTTGEVEFAWDVLNPRATKVQIHAQDIEYDPDYPVVTIDPAFNDNFCVDDCDTIDPTLGYRCYFAQAYINAWYGNISAVSCASCIQQPATPTNFTLTDVDCLTGDVSFDWEWGEPTPPTVAEIREVGTDTVIKVINSDMFETYCDSKTEECDTLTLPGSPSRSYYMVATNSADIDYYGMINRTSDPSNQASATCSDMDMTAIGGYLLEDVGSDCTDYGEAYQGQTVNLVQLNNPADPLDDVTFQTQTDVNGYFRFTGLLPGDYDLIVPNKVGPDYVRTKNPTLCTSLPSNIVSGITLELGVGQLYTFGYEQ